MRLLRGDGRIRGSALGGLGGLTPDALEFGRATRCRRTENGEFFRIKIRGGFIRLVSRRSHVAGGEEVVSREVVGGEEAVA